MQIRINNLTIPLKSDITLEEAAAARLSLSVDKIKNVVIIRKALDARRYHNSEIKFIYILNVTVNDESKLISKIKRDKSLEIIKPKRSSQNYQIKNNSQGLILKRNPVVVGFGPAGMFAALTLAKAGLNPLIFERGADVDTRHGDVKKFFSSGILNEKSNVQFGEGGAGTFSDGKLTTRLNDDLISEVVATFIEAGAPEEIRYLQKPHIGTDKLRQVVKNIRNKIIELGGKIYFNSQVTDIEINDAQIKAIIINDEQRIETGAVFLGIGHSARDTYEMLINRGVKLEAKAFAVGVRIEHPQEFIDQAQYGADAGNPKLPAADYMLTFKDEINKRGAYTFCMCPGGQVVAAASEFNGVVTNGMSNFARNSGIANSAVLSTVTPEDFAEFGRDSFAGVRFQRQLESLAFELGGRNYFAPVQTVGDFLNGRSGSTQFLIPPTYPIGVKAVDLHNCLPKFVTSTLELALQAFNKKITGFAADDVVMTGVETRTSAPCRILRDKINFNSVSTAGLYPIGEGAGYAGGIMSSALDGMKAAKHLITLLQE